MKNIAIIAEYNPLHNGHLYHMDKVGKNNNLIIALSGNFTERGDIAVLNKFTRAKLAVEHGANMVVEIPTFGVLSCAEHYAKCATKVLSLFANIDELSFGSETGDIDTLKTIANLNESEEVKASLMKAQKEGLSYPAALSFAMSKHAVDLDIKDILNKPNNILGIEYIRALKGLDIRPSTIERIGNDYNDTDINHDKYASATSIREHIQSEDIQKYLPNDVLELVRQNCSNSNAIYHSLYQKLIIDNEDIGDILGIGEGLDNRIKDMLKSSQNYDELIQNIKTKRYTMSRIKRTLLNILLGNTKSNAEYIESIDYVRILAIKRESLNLLGDINANVITKYNDYKKTSHPYATLDLRANRLYNLLSTDKIESEQMIIVD